jgi:hypothetical protein
MGRVTTASPMPLSSRDTAAWLKPISACIALEVAEPRIKYSLIVSDMEGKLTRY